MMRNLIFATMAVLAVFCFTSEANAARNNSNNIIYFNAAGDPVGQDAYFCNGVRWRGGELTSSY